VVKEPTTIDHTALFALELANAGQTPARVMRARAIVTIADRAPDRPDWSATNLGELPGFSLTAAVYPGAGTFGLRIPVVLDVPEHLAGYLGGTLQIFTRLRFYYYDAFAEDVEHWAEVCLAKAFGQPLELCDGSDFDRNQ
jgi:hypothetical protein